MERLTVAEAAKSLGISRVTLYKHISLGRVSFQLDNNNNKTLDPSEVARLSEVISVKNSKSAANKSEHSFTVNDNNSLQAQVNSLQALLAAKDQIIEAKNQVIEEQKMRLLSIPDLRQQSAPGQAIAVPEQGQNPSKLTQDSTKPPKTERGIASRLIGAVFKELTR